MRLAPSLPGLRPSPLFSLLLRGGLERSLPPYLLPRSSLTSPPRQLTTAPLFASPRPPSLRTPAPFLPPAPSCHRRSFWLHNHPWSHFRDEALDCMEKGNFEEALTFVDMAIGKARGGSFAELYELKGAILLRLGNPKLALEIFEAALGASPFHQRAIMGRASALALLGREHESLSYLQEKEGELLQRAGKGQAEGEGEERHLDPATPPLDHPALSVARALGNLRGALLLQQGRFSEAAEVLESVVRRGKVPPEASLNLGTALNALGRWEEAVAHLDTALERDPGSGEAQVQRADALLKLELARGREEEARQAEQVLLELDPSLARHTERVWEAHRRRVGKAGH